MWEAIDSPHQGVAAAQRHARPAVQAAPNAVLALIVVGAVSAVWLWWANTSSIHGLGDWLTNAGRILGLLAAYSMVVLLALMARVPALERGLGSDRLARWHSMGGRYSVTLVIAHGLLILWGYAVTAHTNVIHEGWSLLRSYPDVLVGVGISSARQYTRATGEDMGSALHRRRTAARPAPDHPPDHGCAATRAQGCIDRAGVCTRRVCPDSRQAAGRFAR